MFFTDRKELADKAEKWMEENHAAKTPLSVISYLDAMGWLKPSAQPERKKGKWIDDGFQEEWWGEQFTCSICGETMIGISKYCHNCGADMRGGYS